MPVFTEEQVTKILQEAEAELRDEIVAQAKTDIVNSFSYIINQEIRKVVEQYVAKEIAPELSAALVASKEGILKAAVTVANEVATKLADMLVAEAKENLTVSYKRSEILKALFS